jgi:hypothetical protein
LNRLNKLDSIEFAAIFKLPDRTHHMAKFIKIISCGLVAFILVFTADGRLCTAFLENQSETSSENHRDCSSDEFTVRVSAAALSEITHQLRSGSRHPGNRVNGSAASITSALNKSARHKKSLAFARSNTLTTVLRI